MYYIKGIYQRTIFVSEKNYYIGVCKVIDTDNKEWMVYKNKPFTITGYFPELKIDETYKFYGDIVEHPKYGNQLSCVNYERVKPEGKDGLIEFLSSDLFSGIGISMAEKIVDKLGEDCLDKILLDKNCLKKVPKLGIKKIDTIYNTLVEYEESHQTIIYLTKLGFTMKDALLVYNKYKSDTIRIVESNIYKIYLDIEDISFKKLDVIASNFNIDSNDEGRIKAAIIYTMKDLLFKNGDTYLYEDEIYLGLKDNLSITVDDETLNICLEELLDEGFIKKDEDRYYTKEYKNAEDVIVSTIKKLLDKEPIHLKKFDQTLKQLEKDNGIEYNEEQKAAIRKALENNITIITGGPGTGKTTIIKAICDIYQELYQCPFPEDTICLLAPTGRASKRMSEATYLKASTIHRFLKWNKETGKFAINEYNKAFQNLIIVDEMSMLDLELFASLLRGLTNDIRLVLVGDYNQLPSVGSGQVLKDLIDSEMIDTIYLDYLYRQSEDSYIPELAACIRNQEETDFLKDKDDYLFLRCSNETIVPNIKKLVEQMIRHGYDDKRIQVMAPMYVGMNGIDRLNKELQEVFNKSTKDKKEIKVGDVIYKENDKVLQLVNIPDENVYNGDIGKIEKIIYENESESKKNEIYINYDGERVKYLPNDFHKFKHGYAISIHKSQGSEFELVIMPMSKSYYRMLYRKLIYTGITRAKRRLILLGDASAFSLAIKNNREQFRKTYLKERLEKMYDNK